MNYFEYFKINLKSILMQWKMLVVSFVMMPLMMILMLGFFSNQGLHAEDLKKTKITFEDKDNSVLSQELMQIFNNDFFEITEEAEYIIVIPDNYEQDVLAGNKANLTIAAQDDRSQTKENMITTYLEAYNKEISLYLNLNNYKLENKQELINKLNSIDYSSLFETKTLETEHKLTAYETTAISISGFVIITILTNLGVGIYQQAGTGLEKRTHSLPVSRNKMLLLDFVDYFFIAIIEMIFFLLPLIVLGLAFQNVIPLLIPVILLAAIITSSLALFITTIAGKKYGTIVLYLLMYAELLFGGIFASFNVDFLTNMKGYSPGSIVSSILENLLLNQNFEGMSNYFVVGLVLAVVALVISYIKNKLEWGKQ